MREVERGTWLVPLYAESLVEAARIELASKTIVLAVPTSVSPLLYLDVILCGGRLNDRPARFI